MVLKRRADTTSPTLDQGSTKRWAGDGATVPKWSPNAESVQEVAGMVVFLNDVDLD